MRKFKLEARYYNLKGENITEEAAKDLEKDIKLNKINWNKID